MSVTPSSHLPIASVFTFLRFLAIGKKLRTSQKKIQRFISSQTFFCFIPQWLQLLYLKFTMIMKYWRKPRKKSEHGKSRAGNFVHQVLGVPPQSYAWRTGRNLPWDKWIPEGFSPCIRVNASFRNVNIKIQNVLSFSYTLLKSFKIHLFSFLKKTKTNPQQNNNNKKNL